MTEVWITIAALAAATAAIKASGPVVFGGRALPAPALRVISLLAAALLSALVVTQTVAEDQDLVLDARVAGLAAAAGALALRRSLVVTMVSAAAATALVRALT
ncbi:MAG TPA: AzlD domain-containing protein [Solirubrobacterales bacterium]|nr:AzlD domain-containing protein [Solirubrobacterales bacterium]